jgi:hypothetical protein
VDRLEPLVEAQVSLAQPSFDPGLCGELAGGTLVPNGNAGSMAHTLEHRPARRIGEHSEHDAGDWIGPGRVAGAPAPRRHGAARRLAGPHGRPADRTGERPYRGPMRSSGQ